MARKIGNRIRDARIRNNMTQEELAKAMGYKSKSTINKVELGKNDVSQRNVAKYARVLNITIAELMGWDDEFPDPSTAESMAEILTDPELLKYAKMLTELSEQRRKEIYDQIQYWHDKEN